MPQPPTWMDELFAALPSAFQAVAAGSGCILRFHLKQPAHHGQGGGGIGHRDYDRNGAGKTGPQADGIDPEIGQIRQVNRVGQEQVIALGRRIEFFPELEPALAATFGGEHGAERVPHSLAKLQAQEAR